MPGGIFGQVRKDLTWTRAEVQPGQLVNLNACIVGGTNGIGRALARALLAKGARVTIVGRTLLEQDKSLPNLTFVQADLSSLKTARDLKTRIEWERVELLIFTVGIFAGSQRKVSAEGVELDLTVSYLSRLVIIREVVDRLGQKRANSDLKPRVFIMGFPGKDRTFDLSFNSAECYNDLYAHYNTVVGNEALVLHFAQKCPNVSFFGLNPGIIRSNIMAGYLGENSFMFKLQRTIVWVFFQSAEQYAQKMVPLLVSPDLDVSPNLSGSMFNRYGEFIYSNVNLRDQIYLNEIIQKSEQVVEEALRFKN
jgi:NAD(P)-dependent dehydrogenase (short-subunit alcohol dehydrogenase family)